MVRARARYRLGLLGRPSRSSAVSGGGRSRSAWPRGSGGREEIAPLAELQGRVERGRIPVAAGPAPRGRCVAVCMATFEPDLELFRRADRVAARADRRQLGLRDQRRLLGAGALRGDRARSSAGDDRFVVSRAAERLGFYRNFERALDMAPAEAELIALCDQDDRWYPEKLATLRAALGDAQLVYSDQRLVDAAGHGAARARCGRGAATTTPTSRRCWSANTITGRGDTVPPRDRRPRAAVPRDPRLAVPRPLARRRGARGRRRGLRRPAAVRLRPARWRRLRRREPRRAPAAARRGDADYLRGGRRLLLGYLAARGPGRRRCSCAAATGSSAAQAPGAASGSRGRRSPARARLARGCGRCAPLRRAHRDAGQRARARRAGSCGAGPGPRARGARPARRPLDASFPGPIAFEQKRLRRWRARLSVPSRHVDRASQSRPAALARDASPGRGDRGARARARRSASPSTAWTRSRSGSSHPLTRLEYRELQALRDVSFDVHQGEFFGIVGRNGSGKSTLLKILASIYRADAGRIRMAGRLAPFIELGVGFNLELTARENVVLNGVMMGLSRREAARPARRGARVRRARASSSSSSSRTTRRACSCGWPSRRWSRPTPTSC